MLGEARAFGSFSTDDVESARKFYGDTLGLEVTFFESPEMPGMIEIHHPGGHRTLVYEKEGHVPATHTVLNFEVEDLVATVAKMRAAGIEPLVTDMTDADGIARMPGDSGTMNAWFKDPAGNWFLVGQGLSE
ncbi:VOC family protein [Demequina pelophila]|uniref:VOC family protein n=1 Tax=Demequina pelophila TaxID=1638984 RepID=UPI000782DDB0|nr:VOC family protein [Demequina pelophila]